MNLLSCILHWWMMNLMPQWKELILKKLFQENLVKRVMSWQKKIQMPILSILTLQKIKKEIIWTFKMQEGVQLIQKYNNKNKKMIQIQKMKNKINL